jgi:hypothetical protein
MALLFGKIKIWQLLGTGLGAAAMTVTLGLVLFFPDYWSQILLGAILLAVGVAALARRKHLRTDWVWLLTTGLLAVVSLIFLFLLRFGLVRYVVSVGFFILWFIFFANLFFAKPRRDLAQVVNLAVIFLFFYNLGQLRWLFELDEWVCCLVVAGVLFIFALALFRLADTRRAWLSALVTALVLTELFWIGLFLPGSVVVLAALLTMVFYVITSLLSSWLGGELDRKRSLQYIILAVVVAFIIISTASWLL